MASYIHGTGAEKLAPSEREERLQRKRRQDVGRSVKRQHRIRRNQERAMYMDLPYVIMLTLASICTLYLCVNYLHLQSPSQPECTTSRRWKKSWKKCVQKMTHWKQASIPA